MQNNGEETGWVSSWGGPCHGPTPATAQTATPTPQRGARLPRKHPEGRAPGREGGCCRAPALQGHPTRYVPAALAHVWLSPLRVVIALRGRGSHRDKLVASATLWRPHSQLVQVARGSSCWMMCLSAASSWPALAKQLFCPSLNVLVPRCPRCQRDTAGRVAHVCCGAASHSLPKPPVAPAATGSLGTCFWGQAPSGAEGTTCTEVSRGHTALVVAQRRGRGCLQGASQLLLWCVHRVFSSPHRSGCGHISLVLFQIAMLFRCAAGFLSKCPILNDFVGLQSPGCPLWGCGGIAWGVSLSPSEAGMGPRASSNLHGERTACSRGGGDVIHAGWEHPAELC